MKSKGRSPVPWTNEQRKAVDEYLNGKESYIEVAERYRVPVTTLKYWVKKYRREQEKEVVGNG